MFCDIKQPNGEPFAGDPRNVLRKVVAKAEALGYTMYCGPELEFFYFKDSCGTEVLDHGGYFDLTTLDAGSDLRRDTVNALHAMGIQVEYSHHEVAPSQHEIDLRYKDVLTMADQVMTYRLTVKEIAAAHGVYATFMPKPIFGENGSGMHVHQSLFKGSSNAFFDGSDETNLSEVGKAYIAGLLAHIKEIALVTNQWINSYKRLVPGLRSPGLHLLVAAQPLRHGARAPLQTGQRERHPGRAPQPRPGLQPVPGLRRHAGRRPRRYREGHETAPGSQQQHLRDDRSRARRRRYRLPAGRPLQRHQGVRASPASCARPSATTSAIIWCGTSGEWDEYKTLVTPYELEKYLPIL